MIQRIMLGIVGVFCTVSALATSQPPDTRAYIVQPTDGTVVTSPVTVVFGLEGFGVAPAGVERANTGHHHLIIDAPLPDLSKLIPANEHYIHFGGGQTQVEIELAPGTHTLQLLLGDHTHIPHQPPIVSERITVTVE